MARRDDPQSGNRWQIEKAIAVGNMTPERRAHIDTVVRSVVSPCDRSPKSIQRQKAIDAFMDAATEREEEMQADFDCDNDPVVAMMWTLIEELEG